jgi:hypothetical protein
MPLVFAKPPASRCHSYLQNLAHSLPSPSLSSSSSFGEWEYIAVAHAGSVGPSAALGQPVALSAARRCLLAALGQPVALSNRHSIIVACQ